MEDRTLDAIEGKNARAIVTAIEYHLNDSLFMGGAYGHFLSQQKAQYDATEVDVYLSYLWNNKLNLDAIYAQTKDNNLSKNSHQLRIILTYHY